MTQENLDTFNKLLNKLLDGDDLTKEEWAEIQRIENEKDPDCIDRVRELQQKILEISFMKGV